MKSFLRRITKGKESQSAPVAKGNRVLSEKEIAVQQEQLQEQRAQAAARQRAILSYPLKNRALGTTPKRIAMRNLVLRSLRSGNDSPQNGRSQTLRFAPQSKKRTPSALSSETS